MSPSTTSSGKSLVGTTNDGDFLRRIFGTAGSGLAELGFFFAADAAEFFFVRSLAGSCFETILPERVVEEARDLSDT